MNNSINTSGATSEQKLTNIASNISWRESVGTEKELELLAGSDGEARFIKETNECWIWIGKTWDERRAELIKFLKNSAEWNDIQVGQWMKFCSIPL